MLLICTPGATIVFTHQAIEAYTSGCYSLQVALLGAVGGGECVVGAGRCWFRVLRYSRRDDACMLIEDSSWSAVMFCFPKVDPEN